MSQHTGGKENSGKKKLRQSVMGQFLSNSKSKIKGDNSKSEPKLKGDENKSKLKKQVPNLKRKVTGAGMFSSLWTRGAHRDTEEYRLGYPGKRDNEYWNENFHFYTNRNKSQPDGDLIETIHAQWKGNYALLERHHGYIQWLFPIREEGMNWNAQALQLHEIEKIKSNRHAIKRVLKSYQLMLDFYGMVLADEKTGVIERADNWNERFRHLNRSYHNYLRITRILKSLGEFGYEHLKANFVRFVLKEGILENTLPNLVDSCVKYWIGVLRNDTERDDMFEYYEQLSEVPEGDKRPRTRSPSPDYISMYSAGATARPKQSIKKKDEFSDEDDITLEYAMNLIDSDTDDDDDEKGAAKRKPGQNIRVDHDLSDSDADEFKTPDTVDSVEADYWKTELEDVAPSLEVEQSSDMVSDDEGVKLVNDDVKEESIASKDVNDDLVVIDNVEADDKDKQVECSTRQDDNLENTDGTIDGVQGESTANEDSNDDHVVIDNVKADDKDKQVECSTRQDDNLENTDGTIDGVQGESTANEDSNDDHVVIDNVKADDKDKQVECSTRQDDNLENTDGTIDGVQGESTANEDSNDDHVVIDNVKADDKDKQVECSTRQDDNLENTDGTIDGVQGESTANEDSNDDHAVIDNHKEDKIECNNGQVVNVENKNGKIDVIENTKAIEDNDSQACDNNKTELINCDKVPSPVKQTDTGTTKDITMKADGTEIGTDGDKDMTCNHTRVTPDKTNTKEEENRDEEDMDT